MKGARKRNKRRLWDLATAGGLLGGAAIIAAAMSADAGAVQFVNLPGLFIVVGGTLAATFVKFPLEHVTNAFRIAANAFRYEPESPAELIEIAQRQSRIVRNRGLLALEGQKVRNAFFHKGLMLCADGCSADYIRRVMTEDLVLSQERHEIGQRIFRAIGETAPAFGIIGTLLGLVHMLGKMTDPSTLGPAMSLALLTTLYGALLANLIANPIAEKLEVRSHQEKINKLLIIESIINIQQGQHPRVIEELLGAYITGKARDPFANPRKAA